MTVNEIIHHFIKLRDEGHGDRTCMVDSSVIYRDVKEVRVSEGFPVVEIVAD